MKWIIIVGLIGLSVGCYTTRVVEYQQVKMIPVKKVAVTACCTKIVPVKPIVTRVVSPVIEPVLVDYIEPVDATTTTINFY